MELSDAQRKQQNEDRTQSLVDHGVPAAFHQRKYDSVTGGDKLEAWTRNNAADDLAHGKGVTFIGNANKGREAAIVTARALNLFMRLDAYVVPMTTLVRWIEKPAIPGQDKWSRLVAAPALVIPAFYSQTPVYQGQSPLTYWQATMLEEFLLDRLGANRAVLPVIEKPLAQCAWYSQDLVQAIDDRNLQFPL